MHRSPGELALTASSAAAYSSVERDMDSEADEIGEDTAEEDAAYARIKERLPGDRSSEGLRYDGNQHNINADVDDNDQYD